MRVKQKLTLQNSNPVAPVSLAPLLRSIRNPNEGYSTTLESSSQKGTTSQSKHKLNANPENADICGGENLKLSYIILHEHISDIDAIRLLGRVVGNVTSPLENYAPTRVVPGAEIPELRILSSASISTPAPGLIRQSSNSSEVSIISSTGTIVDNQPWLDFDPSLLIFRNLPYVVRESTSATLSHFSQYTKKSESLLTSLLGLSIQSSRISCKEFKLESKLIRTISLTQHNLVWMQLLKTYKREIMSAVRKCRGRMFLVVGVKVARDAEVEVNVAGEKGVGGKLEVDAGAMMGVKDLGTGRIIGGKGGVVGVGSMEWGKSSGVQRKEQVLGDRAFAVEYREVKLKMKLEMGKHVGKQNYKEESKYDSLIQKNEAVAVAGMMGVHIDDGNDINDQNELFRIQQEKNELLEQQLKQQAEALEELRAQQAIMIQALLQQQNINQHGYNLPEPSGFTPQILPLSPPLPSVHTKSGFSIWNLFRRPAQSASAVAHDDPAPGAPVLGPPIPVGVAFPLPVAPPPVAPPSIAPIAPPPIAPIPPPPIAPIAPPPIAPPPPTIPVTAFAPVTKVLEDQSDDDLCEDDYDLELGDDVYIQELDAIC